MQVVLENLLGNAWKYTSRQSKATIEFGFRRDNGHSSFFVRDDGVGFDPEHLKGNGNGHFGWRGIHERAAQIGAEVQLETHPGRGTTVTVTVAIPA